jgi:ELWxxDGT repeat protein
MQVVALAGRNLFIVIIAGLLVGLLTPGAGLQVAHAEMTVPSVYNYSSPDVDFEVRLVKDIYPGEAVGGGEGSGVLPNSRTIALGSELLFAGNDGITGYELWISDGTEAGTVPLRDLNPGTGSSNPGSFVTFGSKVLFTADDGQGVGRSLWITDGTAAGTLRLILGYGGPFGPELHFIEVSPGYALFAYSDPTHGRELWETDGTPGGTELFLDLFPGPTSSWPSDFTIMNDHVVFRANDGPGLSHRDDMRLWTTDGTVPGTAKLEGSPNVGAYYSLNRPLFVPLNGSWMFPAYDDARMDSLWKTDGTAAGTAFVADPNPLDDEDFGWSFPCPSGSKTTFNGYWHFVADDSVHGCEPWITDGTAQNTRMLADVTEGAAGSYPYMYLAFDGGLQFMANSPETGWEPYFYDGTSISLIKDINPGSGHGGFPDISVVTTTDFAQRFFFSGQTADAPDNVTGEGGPALFISDGTSAGTRQVVLGNPGATTQVGNSLFLTLTTYNMPGATGTELYMIREIPKNQSAPAISSGSAILSATTGPVALSDAFSSAATQTVGTATSYVGEKGAWSSLTSDAIDYSYQWYSCASSLFETTETLPSDCVAIEGATTEAFQHTGTPVINNLSFAVTASIPGALSRTVWSPSLAPAAGPGTPGEVQNLTVTPAGPRTAFATWEPPIVGANTVTGYEIQYWQAGSSLPTEWRKTKLSQRAVLAGLKFGSCYDVQVRALSGTLPGETSVKEFCVAPRVIRR